VTKAAGSPSRRTGAEQFLAPRSTPSSTRPPATGAPQIANTALKRYGKVEEIAAMVSFVAGPEAAYITGACLTVDGGTNA
jgi:NAD(P)-dependent dehydrogenase (short-subunit alcohol dehydrogenase family)